MKGLRALVKDYHDLINDFVEYIQAMHRELEEKGVSLPCFIIGSHTSQSQYLI